MRFAIPHANYVCDLRLHICDLRLHMRIAIAYANCGCICELRAHMRIAIAYANCGCICELRLHMQIAIAHADREFLKLFCFIYDGARLKTRCNDEFAGATMVQDTILNL